jgi:hypothetical protein
LPRLGERRSNEGRRPSRRGEGRGLSPSFLITLSLLGLRLLSLEARLSVRSLRSFSRSARRSRSAFFIASWIRSCSSCKPIKTKMIEIKLKPRIISDGCIPFLI